MNKHRLEDGVKFIIHMFTEKKGLVITKGSQWGTDAIKGWLEFFFSTENTQFLSKCLSGQKKLGEFKQL